MINKVLLTTLLLLCVMAPKAQNLSFDLPFITESREPELFFLDPNYNKDHQVEYYSLGDMMKVQYEYNALHQPIKKTLHVMETHNLEWKKTQVTTFAYHNGYLVDEQSVQFYEDRPIYRIYKISKSITQNKNQTIDTIRTSIERYTEFKDRVDIDIPEEYTIRYLNSYRQPDSSLHVSTAHGFTSALKQYFSYNKKQQLIGGKAIGRSYENEHENEQAWEDRYMYEIKYDKHKTTYTQITNVFQDVDWDLDDSKRNIEDYIKPEITTHTLITDHNNRLLSKQLVSNKKQILKSTYNYDASGQTNATMELNLDPRFMKTYGFSGLNSSLIGLATGMEKMKIEVSHTDNCRNTSIHLKDKLKGAITSCYLPNGKLLSRERLQYDDDGKLDDQDKDIYQYLDKGLVEKITLRNWEEGLEYYEKQVYKKDSLERTVSNEEFTYDSQKKLWEPDKKKVLAYDQYGYLSLSEEYEYKEGKGWQGKYWNAWINNAKNRALERKNKVWANGKWQHNTLKKYAFDKSNREILYEVYNWDNNANAWLGTQRDSFYFDEIINKNKQVRYKHFHYVNTKTDTAIAYYFDEITNIKGQISHKWIANKWVKSKKKEVETTNREKDHGNYTGYLQSHAIKNKATYDFEEKVTYYKWEQNQWEPTDQDVDKKGWADLFSSHSEWDKEKLVWRLNQQKQEWHRLDASYVESYAWDDESNRLVGTENTTTINNAETRKLFKVWNFKDQIWKDTIAFNLIKNDTNEVYRYDKYNETTQQWEFDRKVELTWQGTQEKTHTQSVWNGFDWELTCKVIHYFKDQNAQETTKRELYKYHVADKVWLPLYCITDIDGIETSYLKWDQKKEKWAKFLLEKKGLRYSQWNESLQNYVESTTARKNVLSIDAEFEKINLETDYNIVYR